MTRKLLFPIVLLLLSFHARANSKKVSSKIEKVTVFRQGAQVTRTASATIPAGNSELIFTDLSKYFDKESFRINGKGNFTILSVEHQTFQDTVNVPESEIEAINDKIDKLLKEKALKKDLLDVYFQEKKMILANNEFVGKEGGVKVAELRLASDFYRERLTEIVNKTFALQEEVNRIDEKIKDFRENVKEIRPEVKPLVGEVKINIYAKSATSGKFTFQYLVNDAEWTPNYDLRVESLDKPISLVYKANISQNTGEDWNDVELTLSTGAPAKSIDKPTLQTWYIRKEKGYSYQPKNYKTTYFYGSEGIVSGVVMDETGETLPGATVTIKGTTTGTTTDMDGKFALKVKRDAVLVFSFIGLERKEEKVNGRDNIYVQLESNSALLEVVVTGYGVSKSKKKKDEEDNSVTSIVATQQVKQTRTEFKVDFNYTILSDKKIRTLELNKHNLPAEYEYVAIPKLNQDAFLTARVSGWGKHNLVTGEANLFMEGTFMGKSILNTSSTNDTLSISLGTDDGIVVTRESLEEYNSKKTIGSNQKEERAWQIEVRNNKSAEINIVVEDQIPVSTIEDVEIELEKDGKAEFDKATGKLTWKLKISKGKTQKVDFKYSAKFPKSANIQLD